MNIRTLLLTLFALCLGVIHVSAQTFEDLPKLKEIKGKKLLEKITPCQDAKSHLWGYVNEDGKYYVKPIFSAACPFEGKIARVSFENKWGAINEKGLFRITPQYDSMDRFSDDSLAVVLIDGKYGLVNQYGHHILPIEYDSMEYAGYGYLVSRDSHYGTIDNTGGILLEPMFDAVEDLDRSKGIEHVCKAGKWGILRDGKQVINMEWDERCVFFQSGKDGLPDLYMVVQNSRKGIVAVTGEYVIPVVYDDITMSMSGEYYGKRLQDTVAA